VLFDVPDPVLDVFERLLVRDVVHQHDAHRAAVVRRRDRAESLLKDNFTFVLYNKSYLTYFTMFIEQFQVLKIV
jgi:hypothetical protein